MKHIADKIKDTVNVHRTGLELLKIAHRTDPSAVPLQILQAVARVAVFYRRTH